MQLIPLDQFERSPDTAEDDDGKEDRAKNAEDRQGR
jgi:hypothetical protein